MRTRLSKLAICTTIFAIILPIIAYAAPLTTSGQVTSIWSGYANGAVYVGGLGNPGGCTQGNLIQFTTTASDPTKILSIALAAQLSGKTLTCYVNGCDSTTHYPIGNQCYLTN